MKQPLHVWLAWGLAALSVASVVIQAAVRFAAFAAEASLAALLAQDTFLSLAPVVSAVLAALIIVRHPRHAIGWLLMIQGAGLALVSPVSFYFQSLSAPPANPGALFFALLLVADLSWMLLIFPLLFIPLVFPNGRPLTPRWNWGIGLGVSMCLALPLLALFAEELNGLNGVWSVPNPIGFLPWAWFERYFLPWWSLGLLTLTVLGVLSVVLRYRRGSAVERQQIKWLLAGCIVFAGAYVRSVWLADTAPDRAVSLWESLVFSLALLAIPLSIAMAILRQRLWDIDVIIRRTLIYAVLTGVLALAYLGSVLVLQGAFRALTGQGQNSLVVVLSTLAIAALFGPVRNRVQQAIDRRFYRRKYDAARTLSEFGTALRDETDLERLSERLVNVVNETMQPAHASLWLRGTEKGGPMTTGRRMAARGPEGNVA